MRWKQRKRVIPDLLNWAPYFCWWPTLIDGQYVWLEIVDRRTRISGLDYDSILTGFHVTIEYRFKPSKLP